MMLALRWMLLLCLTTSALARNAQETGESRGAVRPLITQPYQVFSNAYRGFDARSVVLSCELLAPRSAFVSGARCDVLIFARAGGRESPLPGASARPLFAHGSFSHQPLRMRADGPRERVDGFTFVDVSMDGDAALVGVAASLPESAARDLDSAKSRVVVRWRFFERHLGQDVLRREIDNVVAPELVRGALAPLVR